MKHIQDGKDIFGKYNKNITYIERNSKYFFSTSNVYPIGTGDGILLIPPSNLNNTQKEWVKQELKYRNSIYKLLHDEPPPYNGFTSILFMISASGSFPFIKMHNTRGYSSKDIRHYIKLYLNFKKIGESKTQCYLYASN